MIKGDVQGSIEAIVGALDKLSTDEVAARMIYSGAGGITESDVTLAEASGAAVIGFNVRAHKEAREAAEQAGIEIRYYDIIYDLVDDVKKAMSGLLAPTLRETMLGNATILEVFKVSKVGNVAGCRVTDGIVERGANVRLIRDSVVVHQGKLSQLKRFKDDAREVVAGQECGMAFENYQDMKVGDVIECYRVETVQRTLVSSNLTFASPVVLPGKSAKRRLVPDVPAIHAAKWIDRSSKMDARVKPGHDERKWHVISIAINPQARSPRQLRVGELIRHELADMLSRGDIHDPVIEAHMITVPEVRMSADLRLATIYIMPLGGRDEEHVLDALESNKRYMRGEIARRVNLKFAPEIRFRIDERFDEAERIEKLLRTPAVQRDLSGEKDE